MKPRTRVPEGREPCVLGERCVFITGASGGIEILLVIWEQTFRLNVQSLYFVALKTHGGDKIIGASLTSMKYGGSTKTSLPDEF